VRVTYRRRSGFQARKMRFWDDKRVPGKKKLQLHVISSFNHRQNYRKKIQNLGILEVFGGHEIITMITYETMFG
jgi:hypothetical protein